MSKRVGHSEASREAVHPEAHALTLFRALADGRGRMYTAVTFPRDPWQGCERTIRTGRFLGFITEPREDSYAVLDVLNENGDIVQDFGIAHSKGFQYLKRTLHLRVEYTDGDPVPEEVACV